MAKIGCKNLVFCANDESATGVYVGALVSANLTINTSDASLYADDIRVEYANEFGSANLACVVDDLAPNVKSELFGVTLGEANELTFASSDTSPEGKVGYYRTLMIKGVKMFEGVWFDRAKASLSGDEDATKGENTTFGTQNLNFAISPNPSNNQYMHTKRFATEAEAISYVNNAVGYTAE